MLELQWGLGPCRFGWVVVVVELLDVVVLPEVVVVVVVGDVIAVRWSRNPRPKFVGVPSYDVMRAGPFRQSHTSHVQPRYETLLVSAHDMYELMKLDAQSFSPSSPVITGYEAATGAMVDDQHDAVVHALKL